MGQFQRSQGQEIPENGGNSSQLGSQTTDEKPSLQGGLAERVAAGYGFNAPRFNTENIRSADSPTSLDSPTLLYNSLAQRSPTTGPFSFSPSNDGDIPSPWPPQKSPEASFEDSYGSFSFPAVPNNSVDAAAHQSYPSFGGLKTEPVEWVKPISQNNESLNLEAEFLGSSAEKDNNGTTCDAAEERSNFSLPLDDTQAEELTRVLEDGYNWRKYGQKEQKGKGFPRSYYKCTHKDCQARKKVERSSEGHITKIIYAKEHNHPAADNRRDNSEQTEPRIRMVQDSVNGNSGSGEIADGSLASARKKDEDDHESHRSVSLSDRGEGDEPESKRRKQEVDESEMSDATRGKIIMQTVTERDILDDGYHWRKYGQKVVKENPNARNYYKCTTPNCTVKKHVERAPDDPKALRTTYDGRHNHRIPEPRNRSYGASGGSAAQTRFNQPEPRPRLPTPSLASPEPFGILHQQLLGLSPFGFSFAKNQLGPANMGLHDFGFQPGDLPNVGFQRGDLPDFRFLPVNLPVFSGNIPGYQGNPSVYPGNPPDFPGNLPDFPGNLPDFPGNMPVFPGNLPDFPGNLPDFPRNLPDFPGNLPDISGNPAVIPGNPSYFGSDSSWLPIEEPDTGLPNRSGSFMNPHIRPPWRR